MKLENKKKNLDWIKEFFKPTKIKLLSSIFLSTAIYLFATIPKRFTIMLEPPKGILGDILIMDKLNFIEFLYLSYDIIDNRLIFSIFVYFIFLILVYLILSLIITLQKIKIQIRAKEIEK